MWNNQNSFKMLSVLLLDVYPIEMETLDHQMYSRIAITAVFVIPPKEKRPISNIMDKRILVYSFTRILYYNKKLKKTNYIYTQHIDEFHKYYVKLKKKKKHTVPCDSMPKISTPRKTNLWESEFGVGDSERAQKDVFEGSY